MLLLAALLSAHFVPPVQRPHDEPPALAISWATAGASACPTREVLIERIAAQGVAVRLGDWVPTQHGQAGLAVEVEVTVDGERWRADLRLSDADGESTRSFSAVSCDALADATALIVAVTLDPIAVASLHAGLGASLLPASNPEPAEPEPEPEPELEPEPPANGPAIEETPGEASINLSLATPSSRWPEGLRVGLSLHGGAAWAPVASVAGLVGGRVALLGRRWRAELGGRWATPRRLESGGVAGMFDAWVVEARGCFAPAFRRLEFPLCPGVELGSVRGRGVAPTAGPSRRSFLWVAPSVSQGLAWAPVERFAIGLELGLVAPLTRGSFIVGDTTVAKLALVGGRALVNLELRLP